MPNSVEKPFTVYIYNKKLMFSVGVQSFTIDYTPEDEENIGSQEQLEWMKLMLEQALEKIQNT
jgi:hypothetical protein